jgi:outer membrane protein
MKPRLGVVLSALAVGVSSILPSAEALATQPLTVFLRQAETSNLDAREGRAVAQQSEAEAEVAFGRLLPSFTARGTYTRNQEEAAITLPGSSQEIVITPRDQFDAALRVEVPLLDLGSYHRYRAGQARAASSSERTAVTKKSVARAVAQAYYEFIAASALVGSARQSLAVSQSNFDFVSTRHGAGVATALDLESARANVERARRDVSDAELSVALAGRRLSTLSGLSPSPADGLPEDDLRAEAPLHAFMKGLDASPEVRASRAGLEAAAQERKAANAALAPTVTASAEERFTNAAGFSGKNAYYVLQLNATFRLDYPLFATRDAREAGERVEQVRVDRARQALGDEIYAAHERVGAGIVKSRATRAQAEAARRTAELVSDRYQAGAATQLDVTQAQRDAFLADVSRIQADAELAFARASLRVAADLPLQEQK